MNGTGLYGPNRRVNAACAAGSSAASRYGRGMTDTPAPTVAPADGTLGVLCVGLGAVTTTLIAGVELTRRGLGVPVGSLTQMGTIRIGKRTDTNVPRIKDFVPLA